MKNTAIYVVILRENVVLQNQIIFVVFYPDVVI